MQLGTRVWYSLSGQYHRVRVLAQLLIYTSKPKLKYLCQIFGGSGVMEMLEVMQQQMVTLILISKLLAIQVILLGVIIVTTSLKNK